MRNFVQPGETLSIPAPAAVASGGVVVAGAIVGIANGKAQSGELVDVTVQGVVTLPKVAALAIAIGDVVYWDATNKLVTKTASGNTKLGVAVTVAPNPSAKVNVRLVPVI